MKRWRHDIAPPVVFASTEKAEGLKRKFPTKSETTKIKETTKNKEPFAGIDSGESDQELEISTPGVSSSESAPLEAEESSIKLSDSKSAKRRREKRQAAAEKQDGTNVMMETLQFLRDMNNQRKKAEEDAAKRANERNELLKELITVLKK